MTAGYAFVIDASADTVTALFDYTTYTPRRMVHNPAGNKLYLLCPGQDELLVMDSTFSAPKHLLQGAVNTYVEPVLNQALNRLYVADGTQLRVIDCNSDSLLGSRGMYGISRPRPVMVPYLNKIYVFSGLGSGDSAYVYDCLRDAVSPVFYLSDAVPCAVYDPRSNRVFFACEDAPTVRALDPTADSVVKTFDLVGGSSNGRMALNLDLGRLYYTDQSPNRMFTIDVLADSVLASESLPWDVDSMFLNRRLGKLFMCSRDTSQVLVFDCGQGTIVDTFDVGYAFSVGLMDERNDKLYLRYGAVVDCRYDSVVARLDSISPSSMAWDAIDNRVFMAPTSWVYVYRDDPYGIEEQLVGLLQQRYATIIRGVLFLPQASGANRGASSVLLDISGRKVLDLQPGANNVRVLPAGVYFVRQAAGSRTTKVVIQR
jgi:DNA-binding beta-propeller fold protein YncE